MQFIIDPIQHIHIQYKLKKMNKKTEYKKWHLPKK